MWQDYRTHHQMEPVTDAVDFVIVSLQLHDNFDKFKKKNLESGYSYLKVNAILC